MYTFKPSIKEAKSIAASWGYVLTKQDGEFEAYPKGQRGDASLFEGGEDAISSILQTVKADATARFKSKLDSIDLLDGCDEYKQALLAWFEYHRKDWKDKLVWQGWFHGRYDGFATSNVSSVLQRLRNSSIGHHVIERL